MKVKKFKALIEIIRPLNCIMAGVAVVVGAIVGVGLDLSFIPLILIAVLAAFFVTAGGNTMNDYFDRDIDIISHKERPIPSKRLFPKEAIQFAVVSFIIGFFLAAFINLLCLAIAAFNTLLLVFYDKHFKQTGLGGNMIISYLVASTFLFGGAAVDRIVITGILFTLAFLANLDREIIKDVEDISGDTGKRRTLPMIMGERKSVIIASSCVILAVLLSPLPLIWNILGRGYLIVVLADLIFIASIPVSLRSAHNGQKLVKIGMFFALISFILGGIL